MSQGQQSSPNQATSSKRGSSVTAESPEARSEDGSDVKDKILAKGKGSRTNSLKEGSVSSMNTDGQRTSVNVDKGTR